MFNTGIPKIERLWLKSVVNRKLLKSCRGEVLTDIKILMSQGNLEHFLI